MICATRWVMSSSRLCSGALGLRAPGVGDAGDVAALVDMPGDQQQPGVAGHERFVEAKAHPRASGQLRFYGLGD